VNILDRLEEVAKAATPGEWELHGREVLIPISAGWASAFGGSRENAAHIAAFSPDVALAVIAVCRAAKDVDALHEGHCLPVVKALREALAALEAVEGME
jgi:hypothetical protein